MPTHPLFAKSIRQLLCCAALFFSLGLHAASESPFDSALEALISHIDAAQPQREDQSLQEITVSVDQLSIALQEEIRSVRTKEGPEQLAFLNRLTEGLSALLKCIPAFSQKSIRVACRLRILQKLEEASYSLFRVVILENEYVRMLFSEQRFLEASMYAHPEEGAMEGLLETRQIQMNLSARKTSILAAKMAFSQQISSVFQVDFTPGKSFDVFPFSDILSNSDLMGFYLQALKNLPIEEDNFFVQHSSFSVPFLLDAEIFCDVYPLEDANGNLMVVFRHEPSLREGVAIRLFSGTGNGLNGDQTTMSRADRLEKALREKAAFSEKITEYITRGKLVRFVGAGEAGQLAEILAFKQKRTRKNDTQIQSITFGVKGYLAHSSQEELAHSMQGSNLRIRMDGDRIAQKNYLFLTNKFGQILNFPMNADHEFDGHSLNHYIANLSNSSVLSIFSRLYFMYNSLQIHGELISVLEEVLSSTEETSDRYEAFLRVDALSKNLYRILDPKSDVFSVELMTIQLNTLEDIKTRKLPKHRYPELSGLESNLKWVRDLHQKESSSQLAMEQNLLTWCNADALTHQQFMEIRKHAITRPEKKGRIFSACSTKLRAYLVETEKRENLKQVEYVKNSLLLLDRDSADSRLEKFLQQVADAKLALLWGGQVEPAGGSTGAVFLSDIEQRYLGVFKSAAHLPWYKKTFGQAAKLSSSTELGGAGEPLREAMAFRLAARMVQAAQLSGTQLPHLVPLCLVTSLPMEEEMDGVFIEFVEGYGPAKKTSPLVTQSLHEDEQAAFEFFTLFDFWLGNLDRHIDNIFVVKSNPTWSSMKCIDNANSFPESGMSTRVSDHMYQWGSYEAAKQPYSQKTREYILRMLEEVPEISGFMDKNIPAGGEGIGTAAARKFYADRIAVAKKILQSSEATPADLSQIRTNKDCRKFLTTK